MNTCTFNIQSLNASIKAQRALAKRGIYCRVISLDPSLSKRGCAYGIELACSEKQNASAILRRAGVRFFEHFESGGR